MTASTFSANSAGDGDAIANFDNGGRTASVAADIFDGSCRQGSSRTWKDEGCTVGKGATCLNAGRGDTRYGAGRLAVLSHHGGPTKTMLPLKDNPAIGVIPYKTTATLNGKLAKLCPTTDQRGVHSPSGKHCNAGAVQA